MKNTSGHILRKPTISLLDLAQPTLGRRAARSFNRALKKAHKDQEAIRKKAKEIETDNS